MSKGMNQKRKLPAILKIMTAETDEEHPITMRRLIELLKDQYGIQAERKSIYDDFEILYTMGYDIEKIGNARSTAYFLGVRTFENAEWKLLIDAVQSSRLLTERKSSALIKKLLSEASVYQKEKLNRQVYVANRSTVGSEQVLYIVDRLQEAISRNRRITFSYTDYTVEGKKQLRHDGKRYHVSPWALCWDDEFYYLIAYDGEKEKIVHFRVDRLFQLRIEDRRREGEGVFAHFDMGVYSKAAFGMFGGEKCQVTLSCADRLCNIIFDRFGKDTVLRREKEGRFLVTLPVMLSKGFLSWVLGFGGEMKIVSPEIAKEQLVQMGKEALAQYDE